MTVVDTQTDPAARTMTVVAEFDAPPEKVWTIWADPRRLERWWGPPSWPATFPQHDFVPGGSARYYMTGPDGEKAYGWWRFGAIEEPRSLQFEDGFGDESGEPDPTMPSMSCTVTLDATGSGTRMTVTSTFATQAAMEQIIAMGAAQGMTEAMGQVDAILAEG